MTSVLHRRNRTHDTELERSPAPDFVPPSLTPPPSRHGGDLPSWPVSAKVLVAILLVAAIAGAVGSALGLASTDDGSTEAQLRDRIATLTQDRDDALAEIGDLDADVATLRAQLETARVSGDDLSDRIDLLVAETARLTGQRDAASALADELAETVGRLEAVIADQGASVEVLEAALKTAQQRLATATAEHDALLDLFPLRIDGSIPTSAAVGVHDLDVTQVYCAGLSSCGAAPALADLTVTRASNGNLRFSIPGFAEGGLFRAGGALHAVVDSDQAVPACGSTARTARITMTILPAAQSVADNGASTVTALSAVITVDVAAGGGCSAALAFYSAQLS